ncbi:MAG: methyltransferase [Acidobacteriota bacterium]|nr:methyltransferase [Acidobacteriota bacterium]
MAQDLTEIPVPPALGPDPIRIHHPEGAFVPTPASRIALEAIAAHAGRFRGRGLDWGSGSGLLAIAATRLAGVDEVLGLELDARGVAAARENARRNGAADKVRFVESDSYDPVHAEGRRALARFRDSTDFMIANPPSSSPVGDGFEMRRVVVRGATRYLRPGGLLLLSVSSQYGDKRVAGLLREAPEFRHDGIAATTDLVPFDMGRPDLRRDVETYAREEERGGLTYAFRNPRDPERPMTAIEAWNHFQATGESPLSRWQSVLLVRED